MRTSTNLATDPTRIPWPGAAWNNPGTSRVKDVTDLHLVREAYGPSGEPYKLLVGKLSGKEAYVLTASNGERMLLKDLQGNLVTDPREVESLVQVITGGHLVAGPAVILSGPALAAVVAAASVFTLSYLRATSEQDKTAAKNQFFAAINDAINKFPEEADAIIESVKTTLGTVLGQGEDFIKIMSSLVGSVLGRERPGENQKPQTPQPPPHATTSHSSSPPSSRPNSHIPPPTEISFGTNKPIPNTSQKPGENLSTWRFKQAVEGTIGSHQDFVDRWNRLEGTYENLVALHENLRDPLPPGVTLTQLLVNYQQELIQRRVASLQSALSKDPKAVGAVRQQLEMLENFLHSTPGLQKSGVSAYARKLIELFEQVINRSTPSGVTGAPPAAEFNLAQVAQQIQSLGVKYPGLQTYLQDILRLPAEERWQKLQHLLNGTVSAPGMPPMGPDDQKLLKMVIEGLCNALGSTMFDSLQGKSLEQQLQGLSIAFVVGALTEGNLETRIDVFVANALAAGLEDYVRQLAGLDPAQSGLNNIINMLFGGGLGLGMNELAGLFFKSLSKPRLELVGGASQQGSGVPPTQPHNSPGQPYYESRGRDSQGFDNNRQSSKRNNPPPSSPITPDNIQAAVAGNKAPARTGYELPYGVGSDGNRPYTLGQLIAVLNKDGKIGGNNGYPRSDRGQKGPPYVLIINNAGLLHSFLSLRSFVLNGKEAEALVKRGYGLDKATKREINALDAWSDIAAQIKQALSNGKIGLSEALSAFMAAADALNIAPNRPSDGFSELFGQHVVGFLEVKNIKGETLGQSIKSEESLKKFLDDINLSQNNRDHLTAFLKEKYKNLTGHEMPKTDKEAVAVSSSQFVKDWGGWIFGAIVGLGAGAGGIVALITSGTTMKTSTNLGTWLQMSEQGWWRSAMTVFGDAAAQITQQGKYITSGAYSEFFDLFPQMLESLDKDVKAFKEAERQYKDLEPSEQTKYVQNIENIKSHIERLANIARFFNRISDEKLMRDLSKLTAEQRKRLIDNLHQNEKSGHDATQNTLTLTGQQWLDLIHRSQPNPAGAFLSSTKFKELKQTWVDKGWIKLSSTNDFVLADPTNEVVRSQMKQEFRYELELYVENKVQKGRKPFEDVFKASTSLGVIIEWLRSKHLSNVDTSNINGVRNNSNTMINASEGGIRDLISSIANNFNSQIDNMAGTASTTLTTVEQSYVERANQEYNLALAIQREITNSMRGLNAGSPRFNTDIAKIEAEISSLSRFSTAIRSYRTSLLDSRELGGATNKNIPQVVSDALSEMNRLETEIGAMQTQLTTELNREKGIAIAQQQTKETQQQTEETQRIAQENLNQSILANRQRDINEITQNYNNSRNRWNDKVAKLVERERNNPSMVTGGGSWVNTPEYINGFILPPPDAGTLDEQVRKVVSELDTAGAFYPNAMNISGIGIHAKDSTAATEIISGYYQKFKKYDTGESLKLPPDHGYRVPGQ